jgi:hypothetical protein
MSETKDDETGVTPEMVRAGVMAMADFDPRFESEEDAVTKIFFAMDRERSKWMSRRRESLSKS